MKCHWGYQVLNCPGKPLQDAAAIKLAEAACGPSSEHLKLDAEPSDGHIDSPPPGKAIVYIVDFNPGRYSLTWNFGLDGQWKGALKGKMYLQMIVDPGEHHLCLRKNGGKGVDKRMGYGLIGNNFAYLSAAVAPNQVTYIAYSINFMGGGEDGPTYIVPRMWTINPDAGKLLVAASAKGNLRKK